MQPARLPLRAPAGARSARGGLLALVLVCALLPGALCEPSEELLDASEQLTFATNPTSDPTFQTMASASSALRVGVFLSSVRPGRLNERVSRWVQAKLAERDDVAEVIVADPLELQLPILEKPEHWYRDPAERPEVLAGIADRLKTADAFICISSEYNHGVPPALSNLLAHFGGSVFNWKPTSIITYSPGPYGGKLAMVQLRAILAELGTLTVSNVIAVTGAHEAFDEDGVPADAEAFDRRFNSQWKQLSWHAQAMKARREEFGTP